MRICCAECYLDAQKRLARTFDATGCRASISLEHLHTMLDLVISTFCEENILKEEISRKF